MRRWYELCAGRPEIDGAFHPERVGSVIRTIAEVLHPFQIERAAGRYGNARDARTGTGTNDGGGAGSGAIACGQGKERNVYAGLYVYAAGNEHMIAHLHIAHAPRAIAAGRGAERKGSIIPCGFAGRTFRKHHPIRGVGGNGRVAVGQGYIAVIAIGYNVKPGIGIRCIVCTAGIQAKLTHRIDKVQ